MHAIRAQAADCPSATDSTRTLTDRLTAAALACSNRVLEEVAFLLATLVALLRGEEMAMAGFRYAQREANTETARLGQNVDLVGVMLTLIIGGIVGFVGIDVMSQTKSQTKLSSGDPFYNASQDLTNAVGGAFSQLGVVFTVIILTVIIAYLTLMRSR